MLGRYPGAQCDQYFVRLAEAAAAALPRSTGSSGAGAAAGATASSSAAAEHAGSSVPDQLAVGDRCATAIALHCICIDTRGCCGATQHNVSILAVTVRTLVLPTAPVVRSLQHAHPPGDPQRAAASPPVAYLPALCH